MRRDSHREVAGNDDSIAPLCLRQINVHDKPHSQSNGQEPASLPAPLSSSPKETSNAQSNFVNPAFEVDCSDMNGVTETSDNTSVSIKTSNVKTNGNVSGIQSEEPRTISDVSTTSPHRRRHKSDGQYSVKSQGTDDGNTASKDKSFESSMLSINKYEDAFDDETGQSLIYSLHEKVALKDFSNEVRASRDIASYLKNMVLLLEVHKSSVDDIMEVCLNRMLDNNNSRTYDQARSSLFTHDYVHQLSRTVQCTSISEGGGFDYDQNWICVMTTVPSLTYRRVCIARLATPANLGQTCQEVNFIIVILAPTKEKGTKTELEVARTFGTIFSDINFRQELLGASTEESFKEILGRVTHKLAQRHAQADVKVDLSDEGSKVTCGILRGIRGDLRRRLPHYWSDYVDGVADKKSIGKTISCTLFLYFACILPCIAFGVLNSENTEGILTVEKVIYSQVFGGMVFAIFGGTPQIVLLTTAPLALYTQIIFSLSDDFDVDFQAFFACVGLFNCLFLVIFSVFDLSVLMQYSTRSSEEIFALFISIAFSVDAFKNCASNFEDHYCSAPESVNASGNTSSFLAGLSSAQGNDSGLNATGDVHQSECAREISLLYLLLLLGTLWLGVTLFNFNKTPYLTAGKREMMADYALPVAVIVMAFIGAFLFRDVDMGKSFSTSSEGDLFKWVDVSVLSWQAMLGAAGLGFCLSLLFFMDQNISAALVNAPHNKMKKGTSYHWDLLVIAAINAVLSMLCFPWVHAALPHSPLHVHALADVEERVDQGHIYQIVVKVRETRMTCILSHILIGLSLLFLSVLAYIPIPVLYGLFLYVAVTALFGNQMFERIQLFFTEQTAYPPNHYIRRVPQRKMHTFTGLQLLQLVVLCAVGFTPYSYLKMFFPVLIFALIPIRHKLIPKVIEQKYLKAMDGH